MGQITVWQCDNCKDIIPPSKCDNIRGYIVEGNIYVADGDGGGGLIGNATGAAHKGAYCKECLCKLLGIKTEVTLRAWQDPPPTVRAGY